MKLLDCREWAVGKRYEDESIRFGLLEQLTSGPAVDKFRLGFQVQMRKVFSSSPLKTGSSFEVKNIYWLEGRGEIPSSILSWQGIPKKREERYSSSEA